MSEQTTFILLTWVDNHYRRENKLFRDEDSAIKHVLIDRIDELGFLDDEYIKMTYEEKYESFMKEKVFPKASFDDNGCFTFKLKKLP